MYVFWFEQDSLEIGTFIYNCIVHVHVYASLNHANNFESITNTYNGIIFPLCGHAKFSSQTRVNHGQQVVRQLGKSRAQ